MRKIALNGFGRLGKLALTSSIGVDSISVSELKETAEQLIASPPLPTVFIPKGLFEAIPTNIILEQAAIHHCIIKPTERIEARLPIMDNLALAEKLKDMIDRMPIKVEVDTENLPKERYHDRTFPKDYWKKKKAKRRIQKQSRRKKYL